MPTRTIVLAALTAGTPACGLEALTEDDLGDAPACAGLSLWPSDSVTREDELALAIAEQRADGAMCGEEPAPAVAAVVMDPALRCAARWLAGDLARRGDVEEALAGSGGSGEGMANTEGIVGSDGSTSLERSNLAGYEGITHDNIGAADYLEADDVLAAWMDDPPTCTLLMDKTLDHVGVGHARSPERDRLIWIVVTGELRE